MKKWLEKLFGIKLDTQKVEHVDPIVAQKEAFLAFDDKLEVIIVSDNHEAKTGLENVLETYPDADYYFHCGDSNMDSDLEIMKPFVTVKGNTDYSYNYNPSEWVHLSSGEHVWMTHGHGYEVHRGNEKLVEFATDKGRSSLGPEFAGPATHMVFYGHTHVVDVAMKEGVLVINPGSIALPRGGTFIRSYARLEITPERYDIQIMNAMDHTIVETFQFPREWRQPNRDPE